MTDGFRVGDAVVITSCKEVRSVKSLFNARVREYDPDSKLIKVTCLQKRRKGERHVDVKRTFELTADQLEHMQDEPGDDFGDTEFEEIFRNRDPDHADWSGDFHVQVDGEWV